MALSGPQLRRLDDRLTERCRGLTPHQYLALLRSPSGAAELEALISAVVVNKTDLFRDEVQLTAFREHALASLIDRVGARPLRVWSAGCSTGEEVASLLVLLAEAGADPASTVLGTDISEAALRKARALSFSPDHVRRVPAGLRERYFVPLGPRLTLVPPLRARASFQVHNLMDTPYPLATGAEGFDVIFCRNVLIYFTQEAFQRTVALLAERLVPGGLLVLSASEPLLQVPAGLRIVRTETAFFYQRVDAPQAPEAPPTAGDVRAPPARQSGRFAAVGGPVQESPVALAPTTRDSGRSFQGGAPGVGAPGDAEAGTHGLERFEVEASPADASTSSDAAVSPAFAEADLLFACVLDGAASGVSDAVAERDLRRCLALDPDHAAARYLLGLLLEQCRRPFEAVVEYRRGLQSLEAGRSRPVPFFLNPVRLRVACAHAAGRLDALGGSR